MSRAAGWNFRTSDRERDNWAATLDVLPHLRHARALKAGCSIGQLIRRLRGRADEVLEFDASGAAIGGA